MYACSSCDKQFSNVGNRNKHFNKSLICQKWSKLILDGYTPRDSNDIDVVSFNNHNETIFIHEKEDGLIHIIWNVFLTYKHQIYSFP